MASPSPIALDGTLGVFEIAAVLATWLFGIETLQTFNYYSDFPKDPKVLKTLVGVIWFLELGHTISGWHGLYSVTVTFYGQIEHWLSPPLSLGITIPFHTCIGLAVQSFFVYRVQVLSKQWFIPVLCCVLNLVHFVVNILLFGQLAANPFFSIETQQLSWEITFSSSIGPAVDMIVAASLVYYLWHRKITQFQQTNRIVDTIMLWTLETTLLTTASGIMQLILFLTRRHDFSWQMFYLIQAKLFSNSMLASLNGRKRFRLLDGDSHVIALKSAGASANTSNVIRMQHTSGLYGDTGFRSTVGKDKYNTRRETTHFQAYMQNTISLESAPVLASVARTADTSQRDNFWVTKLAWQVTKLQANSPGIATQMRSKAKKTSSAPAPVYRRYAVHLPRRPRRERSWGTVLPFTWKWCDTRRDHGARRIQMEFGHLLHMGVAGAEAGSGGGPLALVVLVVSSAIRGIACTALSSSGFALMQASRLARRRTGMVASAQGTSARADRKAQRRSWLSANADVDAASSIQDQTCATLSRGADTARRPEYGGVIYHGPIIVEEA
ncbi:hypothetical protein GGX14DRAFT_547110 [Mycena pura]|uniref:DUF6534 domain-containing protein n=1 Tax=Mycena pura TaxID=153505 RepID=A0AAD6UPQ7_9AGAR|nr:hypothetical protein GGX14DRAFT_547110 [Mycena pura]